MSDVEYADVEFDWHRQGRTGIAEAVYCEHKSLTQITQIIELAQAEKKSLLLTRLSKKQMAKLSDIDNLALHKRSKTATLNNGLPETLPSDCLIVCAGTSDMAIAEEAQQTLQFYGLRVDIIADCGVAGLWRLTDKIDRLQQAPVIIAIAGMEGALFPVLGGLARGLIVAVPGSTGYGVAADGRAALSTALASCSPGVVTVNVDNGFGAACALLKIVRF